MAISVIQDVVAEFDGLASILKKDIGVMAHAIAANISHDVKVAGGDALSLMANDIAQAWQIVVTKVSDGLASGKGFQGSIDEAVTALAAFAWANVIPALVTIGEATLKTMATEAASLLIAGLIASL